VLIDACRDRRVAKSSTRRTRSLSPTHVTVPAGVNALFSCGPEEEAVELRFLPEDADDYRFHGVFFWHVIEGLKGAAANRRGSVNWSDLTSYVQDEVPAYVRKAAKELKQTLPPQNPHAVVNARRPVVLVSSLPRAAEGKKEKPATEKVVLGKVVVSSIGMKLVRIPKGTFTMGSPKQEQDEGGDLVAGESVDGEGPQHEVEITRDFHLGEKEVTQKEYEKVMGSNPSWFSPTGYGKDKVAGMDTSKFPVERVTWDEAMEFCRKLTELDRKAGKIGREQKYRLPTEAEWEYSCRGGAPSYRVFHFGNSLSSTQANFDGRYPHPYSKAALGPNLERTCKVGSYKPNAFGLYDMHGNVREWCADWYDKDYYSSSPKRDPAGPSSGSYRVLRGGGCEARGRRCRSALRFRSRPYDRWADWGFRAALVSSWE
jgi:formylglycine-generating enzyme required for sulfatase activity